MTDSERSGKWRHSLWAASLAMAMTAGIPATGSAQAPPPVTVVSIQFDDGNADQSLWLTTLNNHGMHATFYVNSGFIGNAGKLSWTELTNLFNAGNEIAGHTLFHENLKPLKPPAAEYFVCQDRDNLLSHGFQPTSFAYPFGSFDDGTEQVVKFCGYNSGRGVSGVDDTKVFAETIPPLDAYATRTPPNVKSGTTVATIESFVTGAEQHGGGWVQIVFHHICNGCDAYSITATDFQAFLDWLAPRSVNGTVVKTTAQVIGGPVNPAVVVPPPTK